jgi:hypothetical protein
MTHARTPGAVPEPVDAPQRLVVSPGNAPPQTDPPRDVRAAFPGPPEPFGTRRLTRPAR